MQIPLINRIITHKIKIAQKFIIFSICAKYFDAIFTFIHAHLY